MSITSGRKPLKYIAGALGIFAVVLFWGVGAWLLCGRKSAVQMQGGVVATVDEIKESLSSEDIKLVKCPILGEIALGSLMPDPNSTYRTMGEMRVAGLISQGALVRLNVDDDKSSARRLMLLKEVQGYVDEDVVKFSMWKYDGPFKYTTGDGTTKTIHSFRKLNSNESQDVYRQVVTAKKALMKEVQEEKERRRIEAEAEQTRQKEEALAEQKRREEEEREQKVLQARRKAYFQHILKGIAISPTNLVEVPPFLRSHVKLIKWLSPMTEILSAREEGNVEKALGIVMETTNDRISGGETFPDESEIDRIWKSFMQGYGQGGARFVILFSEVNDIGMLYAPTRLTVENYDSGFKVSKREDAEGGWSGFDCEIRDVDISSKFYMLLKKDARVVVENWNTQRRKVEQQVEVGDIPKQEGESLLQEIERTAGRIAQGIMAKYSGHELRGDVVDQSGTVVIDGQTYKMSPMTTEEVKAVAEYANEEVAKLDFKLPHYLMIHKLIYNSVKTIKVREPEFSKLEEFKQAGDGVVFLEYVNNRLLRNPGESSGFPNEGAFSSSSSRRRRRGSHMSGPSEDIHPTPNNKKTIVTSNDVVIAIGRLREYEFHLDVEFNEGKKGVGDPILVRLDDQVGLDRTYFGGTVRFRIGGKKSYIIESGAMEYFQKELASRSTEVARRRFLEDKLSREVTYDEGVIRARQEAQREAAERRQALEEKKREAAQERKRRFLQTGRLSY